MFDTLEFDKKRQGNFGKQLYYFEEIDSTNVIAEELGRTNSPEGTVVLANFQTGGKGRKGNEWFSPADVNLYFTIILHPEQSQLRFLPFLAALAMIRQLQRVGISGDLKWPNDVMVSGKKISGILIRTFMDENALRLVLVGGGINVNCIDFTEQLRNTATSIALETGATTSRESFLAGFLLEFERLYEKISEMSWDDFCQEIEAHSTYLRGCTVQILQDERTFQGTTMGLDSFGGLVIETPLGIQTFYAGEIQSCRKK